MKYALVNPWWDFRGSIYFGCPEPHLPLEFGFARALLERCGHEVLLLDGFLENLSRTELKDRLQAFGPDFTILTTAPSYLFWRCPPPELRVPRQAARALRGAGGKVVAVGPHGSTTPEAVLRKLEIDLVIRGEFEGVLPLLATGLPPEGPEIPSLASLEEGEVRITGAPARADLKDLPALRWPGELVRRHRHQHHRFDAPPAGSGAEVEASRGCPFHCSFCARENFRAGYRERPIPVVLEELDGLMAQGVEYVYFIDELFLPRPELLRALAARPVTFGIQTRIDLWEEGELDLLGEAGCVSVEAGIESVSEAGRRLLLKPQRLDDGELIERLAYAKKRIPFVQATLLDGRTDDPGTVAAWRSRLQGLGLWANQPVPLFPYPGSGEYEKRWGPPDGQAWERAHRYYLSSRSWFSDLQERKPLPLERLESEEKRD
ncbi:MAG: TIGR04295 family B12-binding domain-containing radical SAM protein [Deltaproteobacteria bacterium]|nr:TIGR04295 family B12-binding domain-containing radical SAM protein [Deltaproteobacteria bacterium]